MEMKFLANPNRGLFFSKFSRVHAPRPPQESRKHFKQLWRFVKFRALFLELYIFLTIIPDKPNLNMQKKYLNLENMGLFEQTSLPRNLSFVLSLIVPRFR